MTWIAFFIGIIIGITIGASLIIVLLRDRIGSDLTINRPRVRGGGIQTFDLSNKGVSEFNKKGVNKIFEVEKGLNKLRNKLKFRKLAQNT